VQHGLHELTEAFGLEPTKENIEEMRDMECYCYVAQYSDKLLSALCTERMRRVEFMKIVESTLRLSDNQFNISDELCKQGTEIVKKTDFWEYNETAEEVGITQ